MELYFSNESYKKKAMHLAANPPIHYHSAQEAFDLLMGSDNPTHPQNWKLHCINVGRVCGMLAEKCGVDCEHARALGYVHDIGRWQIHSFDHALRGFEILVDQGWEAEAIGCLTHSFLNGGRCANNEEALSDFFVDPDGRPGWKEGHCPDDVEEFLSRYAYTDFDLFLNVADLMATSKGIVTPVERLNDIATRRQIDPVNRGYFLAEFTNTLNGLGRRIEQITGCKDSAFDRELYYYREGMTIEEITYRLTAASSAFYKLIC
ncbi:MAG: HDIG domain-containing metalloprotein [Candidatus Weimeria sp.]|nr:HDIG domain-containing metalloprotein [Candidatus Weimeria sp.]